MNRQEALLARGGDSRRRRERVEMSGLSATGDGGELQLHQRWQNARSHTFENSKLRGSYEGTWYSIWNSIMQPKTAQTLTMSIL